MDKNQLNQILKSDASRYDRIPGLKDLILRNESWFIFRYIRHLRFIEYYQSKRGINKIKYLYHFLLYKRLGFMLRMAIYPNTVGGGVRIYHVGSYLHIGPNVRIGENCTIVSGLVFGNKTENSSKAFVTVGKGCYFGLNVTILGDLKIGDNVTIGAHSVVLKDISSNSIVAGIPAKIIHTHHDKISNHK